jgi:endoplasmic reticulum-Golgi intermediate compartment protein 3
VDAVDYNGQQQINVDHEIYKMSRGDKDQDLGMYKKITGMGDKTGETYLPPGYCGSCFGAVSGFGEEARCCNTCDELKEAYRQYGRSEKLTNTAPQCVRERKYGALPDEFGCRVRGTIRVNKMEGNFHIAAGSSHGQQHQDHSHHIHHVNRSTINSFDISHHINHLSFGSLFYPGQEFPLDNTDYIAPGLGNLVYWVQLVPTVYETVTGDRAFTNQFSSYPHYTPVDTSKPNYRLPGVFFRYEFYPMRITYVESSKSFFSFLLRVFAILGGMYGIVRMGFTFIGTCIAFRSVDAAKRFDDIFG